MFRRGRDICALGGTMLRLLETLVCQEAFILCPRLGVHSCKNKKIINRLSQVIKEAEVICTLTMLCLSSQTFCRVVPRRQMSHVFRTRFPAVTFKRVTLYQSVAVDVHCSSNS